MRYYLLPQEAHSPTPITAKIDEKAGKLIITCDLLNPPRPSATGKTTVLATSSGNQATTALYDGKPIIIGLNAYVK